MNTKRSFELSDYVIQFKSVLDVPEISIAFYNFLKLEYASDNWDFILELKLLEEIWKKKNFQKILTQVKQIISTFIETNSPKEILVGKIHKRIILEQIEKLENKNWNLEKSPTQLFEPLKNLVILEYKNDSFKRFSREPECLKLLEKYKDNRNVLLPQLSMVYNYKDEDFDGTTFDHKDREFLEKFVVDNPNWELSFSNKKMKLSAFKSTWNYFPNVSFLTNTYLNTKVQIIFECSLQELACAVFSGYHQNDPQALEVKIIEFKNSKHVIFQQKSTMGKKSLDPRVKRLIYTVDYDPEKKQLTSKAKPSRIPGAPFLKPHMIDMVVKKGETPIKVKSLQYFTYYTNIFTVIDDNRTMFEQITAFDVGGNGFSTSMMEKRYTSLYSSYSKKLKELRNRKKISDFTLEFNDLHEGFPKEPLGKLIYDLDIDGQDEEYRKRMEKRNQVFDLSKFVVRFSAIKRKEIEVSYYEFLKKECNTDSWDFIIDFVELVNIYQKKKKEDIVKLKLKHIIDTYIERKSRKNLSLVDKDQKEILEFVNDIPKCISCLQKVYGIFNMEHQLDSFKRFIRTKEAKLILPKYQHDAEVMTPILDFVSIYEKEDFDIKKITDKDVQFTISISDNASTWDQIHSGKHSKISVSKVNWFQRCSIESSSLVSYETKYEFNFPIEQVANGYLTLSNFNKVDLNIKKVNFKKFIEETNQNNDSIILDYEMMWSLKHTFKRENVYSFITKNDKLFFIGKPITPKDNNWFRKDDNKIQYFHYEVIALSKKCGNSTIVQHIMCINSNEKLAWDEAMIYRSNSFYPSLLSSISRSKSKILDLKEMYLQKNENDEWIEPIGKLLLDINFSDCNTPEVSETDDSNLNTLFDAGDDSFSIWTNGDFSHVDDDYL
eukprot:gene9657-1864_t